MQNAVLEKILKFKPLIFHLKGRQPVYFHNAPQYWIRATNNPPYFWNEKGGEKISCHIKNILVGSLEHSQFINSVLNSTLFYIWFISLSNCRDFVLREIQNFPISLDSVNYDIFKLQSENVRQLMESYEANKFRKETFYKTTGKVVYDEYYPKKSKDIIDEIDKVLAEHYGFSQEELDFIINYDIKYRMGKELEEDE